MRILDFLFPPRVDEAALREISDDGFIELVAPRLVPATRPATIALLPFQDPRVRSAIHEGKYHGSERAFRLLGEALTEYLRDRDDLEHRKLVLVPIPLGKQRRKERGFNQVNEVLLRAVGALDAGSDIEIDVSLLTRTRETPTQVSLPREAREANTRGAFRTARPPDPSYLYIVVDDVLTTGATLQAAIDALKEAGAENILPIALAH